MYNSEERYLLELEKLCFNILDKLSFQWKKYQFNPFFYAGSIIYLADIILAAKNGHNHILTQKIISQFTGIKESTLRNIYIKYLKQFNPNV